MRHDSDVMGSPQNIGIFHLIDGVLAAKDIYECPSFGNSYCFVSISCCGLSFLLGSHATIIVLIIYYRITIKIIKNVSIE